MTIRRIPVFQFHAALKCQGVANHLHFAFKCPICGTIQSAQDLIDAGAGLDFERVQPFVGFSCIGRFTGALPYSVRNPQGVGCDWTLGGLFQLHKLEVEMPDGTIHRTFEPAAPDEAKAHERNWRVRQQLRKAS